MRSNIILTRFRAREFSAAIGGPQSGGIAIFDGILHRAAIDLP
jgi:hypothetical protein